MKKIVALAVLAVGMLVGAGTAAAYPPRPTPVISAPVTVAPNSAVTIVVSNVYVGESVTLVFLGETYTEVVIAGQGLSPKETGSASFALTAPAEAGTYPVSAFTADGSKLQTSVTVSRTAGPDPGDQGKKGPGTALPSTGSNLIVPGAGIALAAVAGGLGLLLVSKRRRTTAA